MEEQNFVIYIGIWQSLSIIVAIIVGVWYTATKLSNINTNVENFDKRLTGMEGRLDNAFGNKSPISLLPKGEIILEESGLKKYIDDNMTSLHVQCQNRYSTKSPYDIQKSAFDLFDKMDLQDLDSQIKTVAYNHGSSISTIRRIGGIYFRDKCLSLSGFKPEDLDKSKTK